MMNGWIEFITYPSSLLSVVVCSISVIVISDPWSADSRRLVVFLILRVFLVSATVCMTSTSAIFFYLSDYPVNLLKLTARKTNGNKTGKRTELWIGIGDQILMSPLLTLMLSIPNIEHSIQYDFPEWTICAKNCAAKRSFRQYSTNCHSSA